jgi:hypothetical protein
MLQAELDPNADRFLIGAQEGKRAAKKAGDHKPFSCGHLLTYAECCRWG